MIRPLSLALLLFVFAAPAARAAEDGKALLQKMIDAREISDSESEVAMTIANAKGSMRCRAISEL